MEGRRYMVAVDESQNSERAFRYALRQTTDKDEVLVVTTVEKKQAFPDKDGKIHQSSVEFFNQEASAAAEHLLTKYSALCKAESKTCSFAKIPILQARSAGTIGEAICSVAETNKIDTLFLGSRGMDGFKRMMLGSVSSYCVHNCHCTTTVVKTDVVEPKKENN
ncbi:UspA domain protein [Balamuthia mandrillaris]